MLAKMHTDVQLFTYILTWEFAQKTWLDRVVVFPICSDVLWFRYSIIIFLTRGIPISRGDLKVESATLTGRSGRGGSLLRPVGAGGPTSVRTRPAMSASPSNQSYSHVLQIFQLELCTHATAEWRWHILEVVSGARSPSGLLGVGRWEDNGAENI
jgi:hypothetical protein